MDIIDRDKVVCEALKIVKETGAMPPDCESDIRLAFEAVYGVNFDMKGSVQHAANEVNRSMRLVIDVALRFGRGAQID